MWFKWLWTWHGCWCQVGWSEYFRTCSSTGVFTHNHLYGLILKKENEWQFSTRRKCQMPEKNGQIGWRWYKGNSNSNNHLFQPRYAEDHLWIHNTSNLEADGLQQQKTTPRVQSTNLQQLRNAIMSMDQKALRNVSSILLNLCRQF